MLILLNKPFHVLSQFTGSDNRVTLADFVSTKGVYPAGRLDYDSEGLLLLTDNGHLQARISHPSSKLAKVYRVQVEGTANQSHVARLRAGCQLKDGQAKAVSARLIEEPGNLWPRSLPIRERKSIPTSWTEVTISEGRNRQVRRMTAAIGLPTLRLIRVGIGPWTLAGLNPGETRIIQDEDAWRQIKS
ncbi:MAG: pseudouridine synthase [Arenicellaceae bacterium]|nr:pseudouridine synthase [Arenicellaceae bacterium]